MTLAEVIRFVESKKRTMKLEAQQKASFDYALADLIGRSVARLHSSSNKMPHIAEIYPNLFDSEELEEQLQQKKLELEVARIKGFVASHNANYKERCKDE